MGAIRVTLPLDILLLYRETIYQFPLGTDKKSGKSC